MASQLQPTERQINSVPSFPSSTVNPTVKENSSTPPQRSGFNLFALSYDFLELVLGNLYRPFGSAPSAAANRSSQPVSTPVASQIGTISPNSQSVTISRSSVSSTTVVQTITSRSYPEILPIQTEIISPNPQPATTSTSSAAATATIQTITSGSYPEIKPVIIPGAPPPVIQYKPIPRPAPMVASPPLYTSYPRTVAASVARTQSVVSDVLASTGANAASSLKAQLSPVSASATTQSEPVVVPPTEQMGTETEKKLANARSVPAATSATAQPMVTESHIVVSVTADTTNISIEQLSVPSVSTVTQLTSVEPAAEPLTTANSTTSSSQQPTTILSEKAEVTIAPSADSQSIAKSALVTPTGTGIEGNAGTEGQTPGVGASKRPPSRKNSKNSLAGNRQSEINISALELPVLIIPSSDSTGAALSAIPESLVPSTASSATLTELPPFNPGEPFNVGKILKWNKALQEAMVNRELREPVFTKKGKDVTARLYKQTLRNYDQCVNEYRKREALIKNNIPIDKPNTPVLTRKPSASRLLQAGISPIYDELLDFSLEGKASLHQIAPVVNKAEGEAAAVGGYLFAVAHGQMKETGIKIKEAYLAKTLELGLAREKDYSVQLFAVFEGQGGPLAAQFIREHLEKKLIDLLRTYNSENLTEEGIYKALKLVGVHLHNGFVEQHKKEAQDQGAAVAIALIVKRTEKRMEDQKEVEYKFNELWTANIGNCRAILDFNGSEIQMTEDPLLSFPHYAKEVEKRGGKVKDGKMEPELGGEPSYLARAIGHTRFNGTLSARAKVSMHRFEEDEESLEKSHKIKEGLCYSHVILCAGHQTRCASEIARAANKRGGVLSREVPWALPKNPLPPHLKLTRPEQIKYEMAGSHPSLIARDVVRLSLLSMSKEDEKKINSMTALVVKV